MKVYVRKNGVIISGKAWEIRAALVHYQKSYRFVNEWIKEIHKNG
ncbi:Z-ring formation inhibitor MciZ [Bacillus spongiae]|uniref:Z-ring formation inhibitor MciZ n=1 Tax=Bacillus spongiae TaxID=2683610 RepID=A0ABU8HD47_9BACI